MCLEKLLLICFGIISAIIGLILAYKREAQNIREGRPDMHSASNKGLKVSISIALILFGVGCVVYSSKVDCGQTSDNHSGILKSDSSITSKSATDTERKANEGQSLVKFSKSLNTPKYEHITDPQQSASLPTHVVIIDTSTSKSSMTPLAPQIAIQKSQAKYPAKFDSFLIKREDAVQSQNLPCDNTGNKVDSFKWQLYFNGKWSGPFPYRFQLGNCQYDAKFKAPLTSELDTIIANAKLVYVVGKCEFGPANGERDSRRNRLYHYGKLVIEYFKVIEYNR